MNEIARFVSFACILHARTFTLASRVGRPDVI